MMTEIIARLQATMVQGSGLVQEYLGYADDAMLPESLRGWYADRVERYAVESAVAFECWTGVYGVVSITVA